jgi:hypothetical protein
MRAHITSFLLLALVMACSTCSGRVDTREEIKRKQEEKRIRKSIQELDEEIQKLNEILEQAESHAPVLPTLDSIRRIHELKSDSIRRIDQTQLR